MTKQDYLDAGYKLSLQVDQSEIARAEDEVDAAYISPIVGSAQIPTDIRAKVVMCLAFMLLCKRKIFATRAGGALKATAQSVRADEQETIGEMAKTCHLYLQELRKVDGVENPTAEVTDICGVYFKTNYFSL